MLNTMNKNDTTRRRTDSSENAESIAKPRVSDPEPVTLCHC